MTVALDATPLTAATGGIRRYVAELHAALSARYPEDRWLLLSDQLAPPKGWWHRRWWLNGLRHELARQAVDVFHGTDFAVPYRRACPAVMTIHDLSPWRFPNASPRVRRRTPWLVRTRRASHFITPGEAIRQEVMALFDLPADRVHAIPLAASAVFQPGGANPRTKPYLLTVGALEPRKNLRRAIDAWRAFAATHDLVVVGREQGVAPAREAGIHYTGAIGDGELAALYTHASVFLFPSLYEGFGLPILEAMQCGAPVVISNDAALRETAGGAAPACDGLDEWIEAIRVALQDRDEHQRKGQARAKQFTWQATAEKHHEVYRHALRSR